MIAVLDVDTSGTTGAACMDIEPKLTKAEFLARFAQASGYPTSAITPDGIKQGRFERIAIACPDNFIGSDHRHWIPRSGHVTCAGWVLVEPERPAIAFKGGEYSVTDHRTPSKTTPRQPDTGGTRHKFWQD